MGFLFPEKHDIFVSYAHDDNQSYGGWIHNFVERFREQFPGTLRRVLGADPRDQELRDRLTKGNIDIFIDHAGLPTAGDVDATLLREIESSCFLFVFIGLGYLKSNWCEREFKYFGRLHSNLSDKLVKFVQLVFIEEEAFYEMKTDGPAGDAKRKGFYMSAYDKQGKPLPVHLNEAGNAVPNRPFDDVVKAIVETHVKRTIEVFRQDVKPPDGPHPPPLLGKSILFGYPQSTFRETQLAIVREIENRNIATLSLTAEDVIDRGAALIAKLRSTDLFVVLFDDSSAKRLEAHEQLATAIGAKCLWCWLDTAKNIETTDEEKSYIAKVKEGAVKGSASEIVEEISRSISPPPGASRSATILFDQQVQDQESCNEIKLYIERIWQRDYQKAPQLRFLSFDLPIGEDSDLEPFKGVHGIVMIDRTRSDKTLETRLFKLNDVLGMSQPDFGKSIFVLAPKRVARNQNWPAIVFGKFQDRNDFDVQPPEQLS